MFTGRRFVCLFSPEPIATSVQETMRCALEITHRVTHARTHTNQKSETKPAFSPAIFRVHFLAAERQELKSARLRCGPSPGLMKHQECSKTGGWGWAQRDQGRVDLFQKQLYTPSSPLSPFFLLHNVIHVALFCCDRPDEFGVKCHLWSVMSSRKRSRAIQRLPRIFFSHQSTLLLSSVLHQRPVFPRHRLHHHDWRLISRSEPRGGRERKGSGLHSKDSKSRDYSKMRFHSSSCLCKLNNLDIGNERRRAQTHSTQNWITAHADKERIMNELNPGGCSEWRFL